MALNSWEGPLAPLKWLLQSQTSSQETKGQKVTGLGVEGGVAIKLSQKNAIIQEMIEEFLQDWPKESFSVNSGGLRMPSTQAADASIDPLWSNEDRRAERAPELYKSRSSSLSVTSAKSLRKSMLLFG